MRTEVALSHTSTRCTWNYGSEGAIVLSHCRDLVSLLGTTEHHKYLDIRHCPCKPYHQLLATLCTRKKINRYHLVSGLDHQLNFYHLRISSINVQVSLPPPQIPDLVSNPDVQTLSVKECLS